MGWTLGWRKWVGPAALAAAVLGGGETASAVEFTLEKSEDGKSVEVKVDGKLFTRYLTISGTKPVLYPILGPTDKPMSRAYPLEKVEGEKTDHIHQRSMWFTQEHVNGHDFWAEPESTKEKKPKGSILHQKFLRLEEGETAVISTENQWVSPEGKPVLSDVRTLTFGADDSARWIDFDVTMKANHGEVHIGDTKEGTFGYRVPTSIDVDAKKGGKIVNSEGLVDAAAWGKPAKWVDYHGPIQGETLGIAILNHPASYGFPTRWHVRTYGLFAANPFGSKAFGASEAPQTITIAPGATLSLFYRVLLHKGDEKEGLVAERFADYSKEEKEVPPVPGAAPKTGG